MWWVIKLGDLRETRNTIRILGLQRKRRKKKKKRRKMKKKNHILWWFLVVSIFISLTSVNFRWT